MRDLLAQAFGELKADRFRTLLSLLGVAIGIFSIVAALTLVDSLKTVVHEGFESYGGDLLFVDREPLEPDLNEDGVFRWWAYASRPPVSWREYKFLKDRGGALTEDRAFGRIAYVGYGQDVVGVAGDWTLLVPQALSAGRGFTAAEVEEGAAVTLVGAEVDAQCGDPLWIDGARYEVIGVFEKAGAGTVSPVDVDRVRLVPYRTMRGAVLRSSILLSDADEARIRGLMRACRRIRPGEPDDFALNRLSFLLDEMNDLFALVSRIGWMIGLFSLLVGGIGMANMLYVSVEERRTQIGICRALGAPRRVIVGQFLGESAMLSLLGGLSGIALAGLAILAVKGWNVMQATSGPGGSLPLGLSLRATLSGLGISLVIGLLSGVAPARSAARLAPVEAMAAK